MPDPEVIKVDPNLVWSNTVQSPEDRAARHVAEGSNLKVQEDPPQIIYQASETGDGGQG
jgi:hypothetical protein